MLAYARSGGLLLVFAIVATGMFVATARDTRAQQQVTINVGDFWFCERSFQNGVCETAINAGDTVVWTFSALNSHTTTECGASCDSPTSTPLWDSSPSSSGTFSRTFNTPGTYLYYCTIHPDQMRGRIVVAAVAPPTATTAAGTPGAPTPTGAAPTRGGQLPKSGTGGASKGGSSPPWLVIGLLAGAGGLLGLVGVVAYRRQSRRD